MKSFALVALLALAGCSKKQGSDCDGPITKGMDQLAATVKSRSENPQIQMTMTSVIGKLKTTLTKRCREDRWKPDAIACFATVSSQPEVRACETKLTDDQQQKLRGEIRQVMSGTAGQMRMPAIPGHPPVLAPASADAGSGSGSPPAAPAGSAAAPGSAAPPASGSAASGW